MMMKKKKEEEKKKLVRRPRLLRERWREAESCEEARPAGKLIRTTVWNAGCLAGGLPLCVRSRPSRRPAQC